MIEDLKEKINKNFKGLACEYRCLLKNKCTFKTGGLADCVIYPSTESEAKEIIDFLKIENISYIMLGRGSDVLFSDRGYEGVIISTDKMKSIDIDFSKGEIRASSGVRLCRLACLCRERGIGGYEFLHGIPGSVGGAAAMNAGAFKREFKDLVVKVETAEGSYTIKECGYGYRESVFLKNKKEILSCTLILNEGDRAQISARMERFCKIRRENQPLSQPSAGSVFKRVQDKPAWEFIDAAGLRGFRVGGAEVSNKHANFIVNAGGATSEDIFKLITLIKKRVFENSGIMLEEEIRYIGEF